MKVTKGAFVRIAPRTEFRVLGRSGEELPYLRSDGLYRGHGEQGTALVELRGVVLTVFTDLHEATVKILPGRFAGGSDYSGDVERIVGWRLIVALDRLSELSVVDSIAWLARR